MFLKSQHNDANGEGGNDGSNDNFSWNCGAEGKWHCFLISGLQKNVCLIQLLFCNNCEGKLLIDTSRAGETTDPKIQALRSRQMKNFHLALMTSQVILF